MKSIEEEAKKIESLLSTKELKQIHKLKRLSITKGQLQKAVVFNKNTALQRLLKETCLTRSPSDFSRKSVSISTETMIKEVEGTQRCCDEQSFRLTHLQKLLLQKQIGQRYYRQIKELQQMLHHQFIKQHVNIRPGIKASLLEHGKSHQY